MEFPESCSSIRGTVFDSDTHYDKQKRRLACFNSNTGRGCCMALCERNGYRCQSAAKYALNINSKKVDTLECEKMLVTPDEYAMTSKRIAAGGEGVLLVCARHYEMLAKKRSFWGSLVKPVIGKTAVIVCTGAITAAAVAGVSLLSEFAIPAALGAGIVQMAVGKTLENVAQDVSGRIGEKMEN